MQLKKVAVGLSFIFSTVVLHAQSAPPDSFPASWAGRWVGELHIYNAAGKSESVPMQLHILATDSAQLFTWTLIYGSDTTAGARPYLLRPVDSATGKYQIDEQNGILLDTYLLGGKLYSRFEVLDNLLLTTLEKTGDQISFETISGEMEPASVTGDTIVKGETIPRVRGYPVVVRQQAVLRREER